MELKPATFPIYYASIFPADGIDSHILWRNNNVKGEFHLSVSPSESTVIVYFHMTIYTFLYLYSTPAFFPSYQVVRIRAAFEV